MDTATTPNTQAPDANEETLVALTAKAAEKVKEIKAAEGIEDTMALRMRVVGGGCSGFSYDLYFDAINADMDRTFDSHGVQLVAHAPLEPRDRDRRGGIRSALEQNRARPDRRRGFGEYGGAQGEAGDPADTVEQGGIGEVARAGRCVAFSQRFADP